MIEPQEKNNENNVAGIDEETLKKRNKRRLKAAGVFLVLSTIATFLNCCVLFSLFDALNSDNAAGIIFGAIILIVLWIILLAISLALSIPALVISLKSKGKLSIAFIIISSVEILWTLGSFLYFIISR